ncbi:hypothetical protein FAI40_04750 [Acetobacteraceae bacterium]|nr:hypothetical protein FAI40_04750 [Acetobacteraceae bacterium]
MKITQKTQNFPILWASNPDYGTLSPIPKDDPADGSASLVKGFPKATMTPLAAGGKPPRGDQFNGILNALSASAQTAETGLIPQWNKEFAQSIGGYPATAIVISNALPPNLLVSTKDDNLDNPFDPNQTSWVSLKKGLQPAGNYAYTNAMDAPPDESGNVGLAWIGLSKNDATARILATDKEGDIVTAANLSDLNNYQPKGAYPITNADIKKPDENNNIGIGWIGGWIDNKNVTRVRATDGIEGVVATCANLDDLTNLQPKGNYAGTFDPNADINANKQVGLSWIGGWSGSPDGAWRIQATLGKGGNNQNLILANKADLDAYQPKGFYTPTFDPTTQRNENKQVGIANFCSWNGSDDGKDRLQVTLGSGGDKQSYVSARIDDLNNYQPKGNYTPTLNPSLTADETGNLGLTLICLNTNKENPQLVVNTGSGDGNKSYAFPSFKDLSSYQPVGNYVPTNAPNSSADENGNSGLNWFGYHTVNGKTNLLAAGGSGSGNLVETIPSFDDLSSYAKLPNGQTNKLIQSGTEAYTVGTDVGQWIAFPTAFSGVPDVTATEIDTSDASRDTVRIYGITTTGFYVAADGAPQSICWMAIGEI